MISSTRVFRFLILMPLGGICAWHTWKNLAKTMMYTEDKDVKETGGRASRKKWY